MYKPPLTEDEMDTIFSSLKDSANMYKRNHFKSKALLIKLRSFKMIDDIRKKRK